MTGSLLNSDPCRLRTELLCVLDARILSSVGLLVCLATSSQQAAVAVIGAAILGVICGGIFKFGVAGARARASSYSSMLEQFQIKGQGYTKVAAIFYQANQRRRGDEVTASGRREAFWGSDGPPWPDKRSFVSECDSRSVVHLQDSLRYRNGTLRGPSKSLQLYM